MDGIMILSYIHNTNAKQWDQIPQRALNLLPADTNECCLSAHGCGNGGRQISNLAM